MIGANDANHAAWGGGERTADCRTNIVMRDIILGIVWIVLMLYFASGAWAALGRCAPSEDELASALTSSPDDIESLCGALDLAFTDACGEPGEPTRPLQNQL